MSLSCKIELRICKFCNYKHIFGQQNCPAFGKECKKCSKKNHFSAVCKVKNVNSINANDFDNNSDFIINSVETSNDFFVDSITQVSSCSASASVNVRKLPVWREDVNMNETIVSFKVDTGSDVTILPKRLYDVIAPNTELIRSSAVLKGFGGNVVSTLGVCQIKCHLNKKTKIIPIEIVNVDTVPLLGLSACVAFGLIDIRRISCFRGIDVNHFL